MNTEKSRVGEVIEANTSSFTAQSYNLWEFPPLGSLVKTVDGGLELYGVVCQATTAGIDPGRKAIPRGKDQPSEEAIFQSNPQLIQLLKSEFSTLMVGYKEGQAIHGYLPPHPARIHAFVYQCTKDEIAAFSQKLGFLNLLLKSKLEIPAEELTSAVLRRFTEAQPNPEGFLVQAGRELARLLSADYSQLKAILERIKT
jgi:hypothetical protein